MPKVFQALQSKGLREVLSNASWMAGEQIARMITAFFVTAWMARSFGPTEYGLWSYALAYSAIFTVLANLGLNRAIVRELVTNKHDGRHSREVMATSVLLRFVASPAVYLTAIGVAIAIDAKGLTLIALVNASLFFTMFDVAEPFFQSKIKSSLLVLLRTSVFFLMSGVRIFAIHNQYNLPTFGLIVIVEQLFLGVGQFILIVKLGQIFESRDFWSRVRELFSAASRTMSWRLLNDSWTEIIAGFGTMALMRLDQIMLEKLGTLRQVGVYSVAVRISEVWYFVPTALVASTFPKILQVRATDHRLYMQRLSQLMVGLCAVGYAAGIVISIAGFLVIPFVFGSAYAESASVLTVHIWAGVLIGLGLASGSWLHTEKFLTLSPKRILAGVVTNVAMAYILIPHYGLKGAAVSTLSGYMVAYLLYDAFDSRAREIFKMKLRALTLRKYQ